jgi:tRNA(Arg) A34 adenosine deaminase TadA
VGDARQAWRDLPLPWRTAFDEAWTSWRQGSLAVGAVVTDGKVIVARGHNQMFHSGPGPISATYMAHAEMNVLAQLPARRGADYSIYTTFEPCYMCTSALLFYQVDRVHFASFDPVWEGMHEWLRTAPWATRAETLHEHLGGELGALGYVLHVSRLVTVAPQHVIDAHHRAAGPLFDCATDSGVVRALTELSAVGDSTTAADALEALWSDLVRLQV